MREENEDNYLIWLNDCKEKFVFVTRTKEDIQFELDAALSIENFEECAKLRDELLLFPTEHVV